MNAPTLAGILSLLPTAIFLIATIPHLSTRSAGQALLADLGPGDKSRRWLELLLLVTTAFLVLPQFHAAGVASPPWRS
jgi:hypothetical protein